MGLKAGILGASGYAGGELLRILAGHPGLEVAALAASRYAGARVSSVHPQLGHVYDRFATAGSLAQESFDVVFSCLPSGELAPILGTLTSQTVIDLSDEHRGAAGWVYGLSEFARESLPAARVANPGCYPTATLLGAIPFVKAGMVDGPLIVDAFSGSSGAGRKPDDRLLFAGLHGDAMAYGTTEHRHVPEMERALSGLGAGDIRVSFIPHLVPMARGLIATIRLPIKDRLDDAQVSALLQDAYADERFVHVVDDWPRAKAVAGSNHVHVHAKVDPRTAFIVCSVAIDNLGKGAAGQAIQNANLCFGLPEDMGLEAMGLWP